ncbi:MAG: di-trans,poly-cis-decaprenylcistransferase [Chloroflexi bacterium]|nr:di-trans,poly-cis-decaprenylcistransferase [Chloroflexota bacterium]
MDGNGRWAKKHNRPRIVGHKAGTENIRRIIHTAADFGVQCVTFYAFSTENWGRPKTEVRSLMQILGRAIRRETGNLNREGVRIVHLGSLEGLPRRLQDEMRQAVELTKDNTRITMCVAFNYGGRAEILGAIRNMLQDGVCPDQVNEELLSSYLYTAGLPDPDLIIRTAGEMRLSNFLIWQAAYSEYYSTPVFWPDFGVEDMRDALIAYSRRQRRFGGLPGGSASPRLSLVGMAGEGGSPARVQESR